MGVIPAVRCSERLRRARYVVGWRLRYWWMDTEGGAKTRATVLVLAALAALLQLVRMAVEAVRPTEQVVGEPALAYWWVVQLIILIVAVAVAYAMRPRPEAPQERAIDPPTVKDGTAIKDHFGTVWVEHDDSFLLAWKIVGRDAIKSKGGKK